jgi:DMSO/TMAO reductase YedYZ molybdopterin-dependent catalytic subunit
MFFTGYLSFLSYNPWLTGNATKPFTGALTWVPFGWPTHPYWFYRFTQGVHVTLGTVLVPVLLAKLWSVIPKLFEWPPARSPAHALDRASLFLLVSSGVFTFVTGLMNTQYWYRFPGSFYHLHFYSAWIFITAFVAHAVVKVPVMRRSLRERRLRDELRVDAAHTRSEPAVEHGLAPSRPGAASISRRGVLAGVAGAAGALLLTTAGQSVGGPLRRLALLAPRGGFTSGTGPNDFQVNITADAAQIDPDATGSPWRLTVRGASGTGVEFSRTELLAMPQHTAHLPIACVEGWSVPNQRWEGVRLRDLAALAGAPHARSVFVESLQDGTEFSQGRLAGNQIRDPDSLLALRVNGADLSMDHGFPARIIVPDNPGVRNTKWVRALTFEQ